MNLTNMEDNMFATILYDKPISQRGDSLWKRIKNWFKERNYRKTVVNPMVLKLRNTAPTFILMCEMADFIKILEKVFFYKNDIRKSHDEGELITKILSDNKIDSNDKKTILIEMQKEDIILEFTMSREYNIGTNDYDDIIVVKLRFGFGKKMLIQYTLVNSQIDFESVHDYNLLYNVNIILQDCMADIFEEYYKLV